MGYLALSKDSLTRLSHHWLWGLRVDNTSGENFYCAVSVLTYRGDCYIRSMVGRDYYHIERQRF